METAPRKSYPSDVTDEERAFVAPHLVAPVRAGATSEHGKVVERADDSGGDAQASWRADRRITSFKASRSVPVSSAAVAGSLSVPERGVRRRGKAGRRRPGQGATS